MKKTSSFFFDATVCVALFALTSFETVVERGFAQDGAAAPPTWTPGPDADKTPKPILPDWATAQINEAFARFQEWKGDDLVFAFPAISDVHSETLELADPIDWSDSMAHIFILKEIARKFGADCVVDLGDYGLDGAATKSAANAELRTQTQTLLYADAPVPVIYALGNHDHNYGSERVVSSSEWARRFVADSERRGLAIRAGEYKDYGCVDFPDKKCRVVYLNASDEGYYGYKAVQLQFLANALASTPADYTTTIVEHFCVLFEIGHWTNFMDSRAIRGELCMRILDAFVAGTDGEEDGVSWKFSERGPGALSCVLCGDSHFDHFKNVNGVNYVITQGFGTRDTRVMAPGAVYRRFNRGESTLIDVVAIKPEKREVRVFRVGIGGADADRAFGF